MKFQHSKHEELYNDFWNKQIVISFNLFMNHPKFGTIPFFSQNYPSLGYLATKYCNDVTKMVSELEQQMGQFEDPAYIQEYIQETRRTALMDIHQFKKILASPFSGVLPSLTVIEEAINTLTDKPKEQPVPLEPLFKDEFGYDPELEELLTIVAEYFPTM